MSQVFANAQSVGKEPIAQTDKKADAAVGKRVLSGGAA